MVKTVPDELQQLMSREEDEHLEFKEAKRTFPLEKLAKYCVALANERGGKLVLGVTNKRPRKIVGSAAFQALPDAVRKLMILIPLRVSAREISCPEGRVVVFDVPSRPTGMPLEYQGVQWMRRREDVVPMTPDFRKAVYEEDWLDFSAEICGEADLANLDAAAVRLFRQRWLKSSNISALERCTSEQLLSDAGLLTDKGLTYAALILMGTKAGLGKRLPQAELIFEFRSSRASIPYQYRMEFRQGFFCFDQKLWETIDLRNDIQHFQDGLFRRDISTFNETVVREAILNAVCHRDYRLQGSIFVRQFPRRLEVVSPGGFPPGVNVDNILDRQAPRNRRIAESLARCGLVERSGQGMNLMFEHCIRESKAKPDFTGTDDYQVSVALDCEIRDVRFLRFLERVGAEKQKSFDTQDFVALDLLSSEQRVPAMLQPRLQRLRELGVVELTSGHRYILSRSLYGFLGKRGVYTRKRGLDRDTKKALLLKHIQDAGHIGATFQEFTEVFPSLTREQIKSLRKDLQREGRIHCVGVTRNARWFPGRG